MSDGGSRVGGSSTDYVDRSPCRWLCTETPAKTLLHPAGAKLGQDALVFGYREKIVEIGREIERGRVSHKAETKIVLAVQAFREQFKVS